MIRCFFSIVLFVVLQNISIQANAQQYNLAGTVRDEQGVPIANVVLTLYSVQDSTKMLSYGKSNDQGKFSLSSIDSLVVVKIKSLSHQAFKRTVKLSNTNFNINLLQKNHEIEEIVIMMNKGFASLKKDTIDYDLSKLNLNQNDNLAQILKNIPGFRVDENAKVTHNGVEINKMLINGKEVFIYQNKIALGSIENNMLEGLSVINNYQDPFKVSLNGENEEKVVNLKVKKSFSNIIKGKIELAVGYADKYKIKPFLYYFGKNLSVFSLHNFNNTFDKDLSSEDFAHSRAARNSSSVYFSSEYNNLFFAKDVTLNNEKIFSNSLTLRNTGEKLSVQSVWDYNRLNTRRVLESFARLFAEPIYSKTGTNSTKNHFLNGYINTRYKLKKNRILGFEFSTYGDTHRENKEVSSINFVNNINEEVSESTKTNARILSAALRFETELLKSLSLSNSARVKNEESADNYLLNSPPINSSITVFNVQQISVNSRQHAFNSQLKYQLSRQNYLGFQASLENEYSRLSSLDIVDLIKHAKQKIQFGITSNIRVNKFRFESVADYNLDNRFTQNIDKDYKYFSWDAKATYFLDTYNKNRLTLQHQRAFRSVDLKAGINKRIISFDNILLGDPALLNRIFRIDAANVNYRYLSPISGHVFGLDFGMNRAPEVLIQSIVTSSLNQRHLLFVKGYKAYNMGLEYGQYFLKNTYPINSNFTADYNTSTSYQLNLNQQVSIKQNTSNLKLNVNSFSKYALNFNVYLNWQKTNIIFGNGENSQQDSYSLAAGPKINYKKKLEFNPLLKALKTRNDLIKNDFLDVDLKSSYLLNDRFTFHLTGENVLNALKINKNTSLPNNSQSGGVEYFTNYINTLGYLIIGASFRL